MSKAEQSGGVPEQSIESLREAQIKISGELAGLYPEQGKVWDKAMMLTETMLREFKGLSKEQRVEILDGIKEEWARWNELNDKTQALYSELAKLRTAEDEEFVRIEEKIIAMRDERRESRV